MSKRALICIGGGIGDTVQTTPLIQAMAILGYEVDVWLEADSDETVTLVQGWSPIRRLVTTSRDVVLSSYDEVIVTLCFPRAHFFYRSALRVGRWQTLGTMNHAEYEFQHARRLGFGGPMPPTYVCKSARCFSVPTDTIALHPGSKTSAWFPRKRWPYFSQLASSLSKAGRHVAVVGMPTDGDQHDVWPDGTADFRGKLTLLDTAAFLADCEAVVSNDSGIAHIAAAVGTTTVIIFGPTSEKNYCPPVRNAIPITADLTCRPCHNPSHCEERMCLSGLCVGRVMEELTEILRRNPWQCPPSIE